MAAYVASQAGSWSSTATWGGTGPPGSSDTATIGYAVTVSGNTTVGNNAATGGTPAITFTAGGSLAVTSGTLTLTSGVKHVASTTVTVSAGASVVFHPAASAQLKVDFNSASGAYWIFNGTSGSPCSLSTNLGNSGSGQTYLTGFANGADAGIFPASYVTVSNMGTTTNGQWGFGGQVDTTNNTAVSITNCTLASSNMAVILGVTNNWDGNLTLTNNIFSSSVGNGGGSGQFGCFVFGSLAAAVSGARTHQYCGYDLPIVGTTHNGFVASDCYCNGSYYFPTAFTHAANAIQRCILINTLGPTPSTVLQNSAEDLLLSTNTLSDQHYLVNATNLANNSIWSGFIFESLPGTQTYGDCFVPVNPTGASTNLTIQNAIFLPNAGCIQYTAAAQVNMLLSVLHCTFGCGGGGFQNPSNDGIFLSELSTGVADSLAACKANLFWYSATNTLSLKIYYVGTTTTPLGGTQNQVAPTACDYNGSWNVNNSTPAPASYNFTNSGNGYGLYETAVPGTHDLADQNPQFVNSAANLTAWGATVGQGSQAATLAYLAANPSQIINMIQWIRAGFRPRNRALLGASYPGDPSTSDAAGNPWPGGSPGIGAMAFQSSGDATGACLLSC